MARYRKLILLGFLGWLPQAAQGEPYYRHVNGIPPKAVFPVKVPPANVPNAPATPLAMQASGVQVTTVVGEVPRGKFAVVDAVSAATFSATGLPTGIEISPDGELFGTYLAAGLFTATITAAEQGGRQATQTVEFTVRLPVPAFTAVREPDQVFVQGPSNILPGFVPQYTVIPYTYDDSAATAYTMPGGPHAARLAYNYDAPVSVSKIKVNATCSYGRRIIVETTGYSFDADTNVIDRTLDIGKTVSTMSMTVKCSGTAELVVATLKGGT